MADDNDPSIQSGGMDVNDEELRQILGDDYDSVVDTSGSSSEPAPAPPPPPPPSGARGGASGGGASRGGAFDAGDPPVKKMTPEEEEAWTRQMEAELAQEAAPRPSYATPAAPMAPAASQMPVQPVHFGQLDESLVPHDGNIELLMDVKLPISVELGRTEMLVKEILECGPGTVVELNKLAGEPVDVFVNGRMIAQGEVVVVDEHFGVRVTNLLSPRDRVKSLA